MSSSVTSQNITASSPAVWRDYFAMTKPTITLLVVVTAVPGLLMNVDQIPSLMTFIATLIGAALSSASAAVYNQVVEFKSDQYMKRTKGRSVASGRVSRSQAAIFGAVIGAIGFGVLYPLHNTSCCMGGLSWSLLLRCSLYNAT